MGLSLNDSESKILEEILEKDGDCLNWKMCARCPFASKCLTKNINEPKSLLSRKERVNLALDRISNFYILEDNETRLDHEEA